MLESKQKVIEKLKDDPLMPLRHSAEHVLHTAMQQLYPNLKKVMGPPIEDGFYFDFDLDEKVSPADFNKIEAQMQNIIDADLSIIKHEVSLKEALEIFKDNQYKLDTIEAIKGRGEQVTLYSIGEKDDKDYDLDLCAGPHVKSTGEIKAFKLLSVAGAYYKGNENNKMLTRIYGTAFDSQEKLEQYLEYQEELQNRDHRKIAKDLELYTIADEVGPGLILWLPNGTIIRDELEKWAKETEAKWGYERVATPHITKKRLFEISGHLPYYSDDMYSPLDIDGEEYYLKPMNCPHHHMIYQSRIRSYKELPLRLTEFGQLYRYEKSGSLHGLMRVRGFCQNDAHIYVQPEKAVEEFVSVFNMHKYYYNALGLSEWWVVLGLRDPANLRQKYHGDDEMWDKAEKMTIEALEKAEVKYTTDPGGAAHYGPKGDIFVKSVIGKEYAIGTVQLDLYMPQQFNLKYKDADGEDKTPYVIHRAPLGSHERFIGFLIEHFAGAFPVWLAPEQIEIIPISNKHYDYATTLEDQLKEQGLRAKTNLKDESMGAKIRDAQLRKVPYMLVVGDKELENNNVSVRLRSGETHNNIEFNTFSDHVKSIYLTRSQSLW